MPISVLFKIPEATENFTVTAVKAEGGARLGKILNAKLQIIKNDDPIFFSGKDTDKDRFLWEDGYITFLSLPLQNQWLLACLKGLWQISPFCG